MDQVTPDSELTRALLEQAQGGNRQACERLFAHHGDELRRFIELRLDMKLRGRVDASDVIQETQLEAYVRLPDYLKRRPMPFGIWLRKTAYEKLIKVRRRHLEAAQRAVGREVSFPERSSLLLARKLVAPDSSPSQRMTRREIIQRVRQALAELPEVDREILLLRTFEKLSYAEVSSFLGIDSAAARKRYGRALLRLRQVLFENGSGDFQS